MPLTQGQILNNRYRIVKLLGQGGFGAVYRAWDSNLEVPVAIKENLDTSLAAQNQFKREAQMLFNLLHPYLPRVHDHFVIPNQGQYLVMDYVEGQDLGEMLKSGPLLEAKVLPWISQVCDALSYLHSQNPPVIHRDIKPGNIKITPEGKAMLVDFGISKIYDPVLATTVGARAVTPGYSPPEQYGKGITDIRSDLYALGATLYHLLTGQLPPDSVDIITRSAPPPLPVVDINQAISDTISTAITKAMALDREDRWANAQEFKQAITTKPTSASKRGSTAIPATKIVSPPPPRQAVSTESEVAISRPKVPWGLLGVVGGLGVVVVIVVMVVMGSILSLVKETTPTNPPTEIGALLPSTTTIPRETQPHATLPADFTDEYGVKMNLISAGEFQMGGDADAANTECLKYRPDCQRDWFEEEEPVHTIFLDAFYMDIYEVTNKLYAQCVEAGACTEPEEESSHTHSSYYGNSDFETYPVINVSWKQTRAFCDWRVAELPTEAEWEKAARGGLEGKPYPWGDRVADCSLGNFSGCKGDTTRIGSYPANGYGLFDMAGNVAEWVWDWYSDSYYVGSASRNPHGPESGNIRVLRGGSCLTELWTARVTWRSGMDPTKWSNLQGFRCARTP